MATVVTISPSLRVGPVISNLGMIPFSVTVDDTYAAASGGVTIDFTNLLAAIPVQSRPVHADLIAATGRSAAGYLAVFTKGASGDAFTCSLWNGTTEHAEAGCTQVIQGELYFSPGGQS